MRWYLPLAFAVAVALTAACGGNGSKSADKATSTIAATSTGAGTPTPRLSAADAAVVAEANADPSLPGEYIDLPAIYGGPYPYGTPPPHQDGPIDYSAQGLPPVGGKHWGPSAGWAGPCPDDPDQAPANCGPVPSGIYRKPWHAESLVHNLEHASFVIWYNTTDQAAIDKIEAFATKQLTDGKQLVLAPYPDMAPETVAITVWSRRETFPVDTIDTDQMQQFIDVLECRFDPEGFC